MDTARLGMLGDLLYTCCPQFQRSRGLLIIARLDIFAQPFFVVLALREGSVAEAQQILVDTIENFHTDGNKNGLAFALDRMASLHVVIDQPEVAARLIGWSDATRKEIGDPRPHIEQADLDRDIAAIKANIGADAYEAAYNAGQALTLEEAVAFASGGKKQA